MKRVLSLILVSVILCLGAVSCKKTPANTDPLQINYNYDLTEYIELGNYNGLSVTASEATVKEAEYIKLQVQSTLQYYASYIESTEGIKVGDTVFINSVGSIDGKPFAGATATNYELVVGSGAIGALFEDNLIGAKKGDRLEFDVSVPDTDNEDPDLRGKTVHYEVSINIVMKKDTTVYNDEFVKENLGFNSVQEYEKYLSEEYKKNSQSNLYSEIIPTLWQIVLDTTKVTKYPEDKVKEKYDTFLTNAKDFAELRGLTLAQFAQYAYEKTEDELYDYALEEAQKMVKEEMICYAIARAEGIVLSDEEYKERATEAAELSGYDSLEAFEAAYDIVKIKEALILDMVKEKIAESANIIYMDGTKVDGTTGTDTGTGETSEEDHTGHDHE